MSRTRDPIAKLVVVGPSRFNGGRLKENHYEFEDSRPISELELQIAVILGKNNFTVQELIHTAWWYFLLRNIQFNKIRRPHEIIKRYGGWDDVVQVDLATFRREKLAHDEWILATQQQEIRVFGPKPTSNTHPTQ